MKTAYRKSDPSTSRVAMEKMIREGKLGERLAQVHRVVALNPGKTSGELSRLMHMLYPSLAISVAVESPHKRLPELERQGLVRRGEMRECQDTGNTRLTWYPTDLGYRAIGLKPGGRS